VQTFPVVKFPFYFFSVMWLIPPAMLSPLSIDDRKHRKEKECFLFAQARHYRCTVHVIAAIVIDGI